MPDVNPVPSQQPTTTLAPKKPINWKLIGIVAVIAAIAIGGLGYTAIVLNVFGTKVGEPKTTTNKTASKSATPTAKPVTSKYTLAFIRNDNLWVFANGKEKQLTTDAVLTGIPFETGLPKLWNSNPQVSPDGKKIAFLKNSGADIRSLYVIGIDGAGLKKLANDVEWTVPAVAWTSDSEKVLYTKTGATTFPIDRRIIEVSMAGVEEDMGGWTITGGGCGGGSSDPSDHLAASEEIYGIGSGIHTFQVFGKGQFLLHSLNCTGKGMRILNLTTKEDKNLDENLTKAVASPDGSKIAGITISNPDWGECFKTSENCNIEIFDTKGNKLQTIHPSKRPVILSWSSDGKEIYYTSEENINNLKAEIPSKLSWAIGVNQITLWKVSLASGESTKIADVDAHALKSVTDSIEKGELYVVQVENGTRLYDFVTSNGDKGDRAPYYPTVNILKIDLSTGKVSNVLKDVQQSAITIL